MATSTSFPTIKLDSLLTNMYPTLLRDTVPTPPPPARPTIRLQDFTSGRRHVVRLLQQHDPGRVRALARAGVSKCSAAKNTVYAIDGASPCSSTLYFHGTSR